ncbi:MFS transporter [Agromyces sp. G08B096]|uniref:MFS transporter n=1 Tax=Agromyces sp. G08B096 TaxID=3156399 RepID=A0AAU7W637_9MICO
MTETVESAQRSTSFPWTPILILSTATMLMVTAEMLPAALLAPMSSGLGVSEAATGALVSIWAAVVMVASLPLSRFARRWRARPVIVFALAALALSSVLTAIAPAFGVVIAARVLGAAAVGVLWATVNAFVADLVPDRLLGRAIAVVLGGGTLGMVIGTPLGRLLADASDWRVAFLVLGATLAAAAVAVRLMVPLRDRARLAPSSPREGRMPRTARLGIVTLLVAVSLIGHYGAYTFITQLAAPAATALPGGTSTVLLAFGVASAVGLVAAARVGERTARALVVSLAVTAVAVAALAVSSAPVVSLIVVLVWGLGSGAFPPLAQTVILRIAGPEHRDFAGALIPVLFNGGIAIGAGAASALVGAGGPMTLPVPAAIVVLAAALGLVAVEAARPKAPVLITDAASRPAA